MVEAVVSLQGDLGGDNSHALNSLEQWLRDSALPEATFAVRPSDAPQSGQMGIDPMVIVGVLNSAAVGLLIRSIHVWIRATRPRRLRVTIDMGKGKRVKLDCENLPELEVVMREVGRLTGQEQSPN